MPDAKPVEQAKPIFKMPGMGEQTVFGVMEFVQGYVDGLARWGTPMTSPRWVPVMRT
jgi:hypothetical protein